MTTLKVGDNAPNFIGNDENGQVIDLQQFRGKKLILFFYPKDDTPGCTAAACNLRDNYEDLFSKGFAMVGVSADDAKKHTKFISKYELPFSLIADTEQVVSNQYGVWGEKMFMGKMSIGMKRTTFIIDENGIIERVIDKVDTKNHTAQILEG